jgi:hypothetical protein
MLLIFAGVAKLLDLTTASESLSAFSAIGFGRIGTLGVAITEILFGMICVVGRHTTVVRISALLATTSLLTFRLVVGGTDSSGSGECGCLGVLESVPAGPAIAAALPWILLGIIFILILSLLTKKSILATATSTTPALE